MISPNVSYASNSTSNSTSTSNSAPVSVSVLQRYNSDFIHRLESLFGNSPIYPSSHSSFASRISHSSFGRSTPSPRTESVSSVNVSVSNFDFLRQGFEFLR